MVDHASEAHLDEHPALNRGAAGSTPARGTVGKWRSSVVLAGLISLRSRVRIPPSPPMTSSSIGRAVGCYPIRCWFESSGVSARDGHRGAPDPCKIGSQGSTPCRSTSRCGSVARAAPCRGEGRGFESRHWRVPAPLAQWQSTSLTRRCAGVRVPRGARWRRLKRSKRRVVVPEEAGSSPVRHPKRRLSNWLARVAVDHVPSWACRFESCSAHYSRHVLE